MNVSHFDKQAQRESTCSLVHGTWRCVGAKIACAGACALMVGQLLLPSVALATECADPAAGTDEVAAAPVTPTVAEDTAATTAPAASTAPATDAAPAAQATAAPQQTAPTGATDESNDAAPAEQNTPSDNAATPANDAIMPCGVTDVVGGSGVRVIRPWFPATRTARFRAMSHSKRASRIPMIFPMLRVAFQKRLRAKSSRLSATGPMLLRAPLSKFWMHPWPT